MVRKTAAPMLEDMLSQPTMYLELLLGLYVSGLVTLQPGWDLGWRICQGCGPGGIDWDERSREVARGRCFARGIGDVVSNRGGWFGSDVGRADIT